MIQKTRRKIILVLTCIYMVAVVCITAAFYWSYLRYNYNEMHEALVNYFKIMAEGKDMDTFSFHNAETGESAANGSSADKAPKETGLNDRSLLRSTGVIVLKKSEDGTFTVYEKSQDADLEETEYTKTAQEIWDGGQTDGTHDSYQYITSIVDDQLYLALADISAQQAEERHMLYLALLLVFGSCILFLLIAIRISIWLVRPLQQAIEKQSDFILAAGHELKTPITVMQTSLDLLGKEGIKSKYLSYAQEENSRMKGLVTELLDLSRMEAGADSFQMERLNVYELVTEYGLPFESIAYEKGVVLALLPQDERIESEELEKTYVKGDREKLGRLLGILMDNAIKHTSKGGHVTVRLIDQGRSIRLLTANEGTPIAKEDREKIFEKFYRVDKARDRSEGRYGLGLSIAQNIALAHGSKIKVVCADGITSFYFDLSKCSETN